MPLKPRHVFTLLLLSLNFQIQAEAFRTLVAGNLELSTDSPAGAAVSLGVNGSAVISLSAETRFFRGVEIELSAPQRWLSYHGSLAMAVYADLSRQGTNPRPESAVDFEGRRVAFEPLPGKIQTVYQIPCRASHSLRTTPYVTVSAGVVLPASFPILFRIMPVVKGLNEELENMIFQLNVKPILSGEGLVKIGFRFPDQLRDKPFVLLIDDVLIENHSEERLLKEGEHHLVILSEDYRNESRRFIIERAKTLNLTIELQDPTPLIIFEAPENARIFLDNAPVGRERTLIPVEPGPHEARFQIGDYTITKTLLIQRGKTYRVAMAVDINIRESD
jgi:hypothetical protein